jgi:hypothetical protein
MNKYWIGLGVVLLAIFLIYPSCKPIPAKIDFLKKVAATEETKKIVPDAKAETVIKYPEPVIGKTPVIKVVERANGDLIQVTTYKSAYGLFKGIGLFAGADLLGGNYGLSLGTLYYDRFCLDALAGIKSGGIGLSAQILNNTSVGVSYTYEYDNLLPSPGLYVKLSF